MVVLRGARIGPDGVGENRGAGAAWSTPLAVTGVERALRCSFRAASRQVSTGVTQASVPAKISDHSSRVLPANFSAKSLCTSGKADGVDHLALVRAFPLAERGDDASRTNIDPPPKSAVQRRDRRPVAVADRRERPVCDR